MGHGESLGKAHKVLLKEIVPSRWTEWAQIMDAHRFFERQPAAFTSTPNLRTESFQITNFIHFARLYARRKTFEICWANRYFPPNPSPHDLQMKRVYISEVLPSLSSLPLTAVGQSVSVVVDRCSLRGVGPHTLNSLSPWHAHSLGLVMPLGPFDVVSTHDYAAFEVLIESGVWGVRRLEGVTQRCSFMRMF